MKPEQFIREFGVEKAREVVEGAPKNAQRYFLGKYLKQGEWTWWWSCYLGKWLQFEKHVYGDSKFEIAINLSELKRLVESLEIINRACGAERVIDLHERYKNNPVVHKYWLGVRVDRMAQAVTDYESIYGGGENA